MKANLPPALAACFAVPATQSATPGRPCRAYIGPDSRDNARPPMRPILGLRFPRADRDTHAGILGELAEFGRAW